MKMRDLLTAATTSMLMLTPALVSAQDNEGFTLEEAPAAPEPIFANEVEVGIGYNSEDSFKFREYNGLPGDDGFLILDFDLLQRPGPDSDATNYYSIRGERLGLESRFLEGEYGQQGRYAVGLSYREIPHNLINNALTPYRGTGGTVLTLPPDWDARPSTQRVPNLAQSLRTIDIKNKRRQLNGFASFLPSDKWSVNVEVGHEDREGTKPVIAAFATNGGNPSSIAFPKPVEWKTNDLEVTLGYKTDVTQFELGYHGSFFNNDNDVVLFQNPYSSNFSGGAWAPGSGYPASGGFGLEPDNESHQFLFSGGTNLGEASRIGYQVSYSMLRQDQQFLPYSSNPRLTVNQGLPRQSLDGQLDVLVADLSYTTRFSPKTHFRAHARYEDQDNSTPQDIYVRIVGDTQNQPRGIANDNARINLPYSFKRLQFDTTLDYRLSNRTTVGVEYEFNHRERTFSEYNEDNEHSLEGKLKHRFSNTMRGRFSYRHAERDGSGAYDDNAPFLAGHTPQLLGTLAPDERFQNHPEIRKFNFADRKLDEVKAKLIVASSQKTTWSLNGSWKREDFDDSSLGLTDRKLLRAGVDVSHMVNEDIMLHGYYSYEQFKDTERNHSFRPGQSLTNPGQRWSRDSEDRIHGLGFGVAWTAIRDKLDVDFDYSFSLADTDQTFEAGADLGPVTDAPTLSSDRHTVQLAADWRLAENRKLRFAYLYEHFESKDFTLDGIAVNSIGRIYTFGNQAPDYDAHVIGVAYVANW